MWWETVGWVTPIVATILIFNFLLRFATSWFPKKIFPQLSEMYNGYLLNLLVLLAIITLLFFVGGPARRRPIDHLGPRNWRSLALPTLLGTVIALLFAMSGIARLETGIAASLLATTPIFALPISRFALKEPLGPRSALGTLLAVYGVYLLS